MAAAYRPRLRWTHGLVNRLVATLDGGLLVIAPLLVPGALDILQSVELAAIQLGVFIAVMRGLGSYRVETCRAAWPALLHLSLALAAAAAAAALLLRAFAPETLADPSGFLFWHLAQAIALGLGRLAAMRLIRAGLAGGALRRRVAIIGANPLGAAILADLAKPGQAEAAQAIALFRDASDDAGTTVLGGLPVLGGLEDFRRMAPDLELDLVVLALPWDREGAVARLAAEVEWFAADVSVAFADLGVRPDLARVVGVAGRPTLQIVSRPLKGSMFLIKRVEDYVVASIALLLLSPVMLAAAIAIRLEGPGEIFFRQPRPGFGRRPFMIYKFRTMSKGDDGAVGATRNDPRITKVGAFLRRTSIDEIPQFINVLQGDMSVVGPRPYPVRMLLGDGVFSEQVRRYVVRYRIRPGITGLAQVSGLRSSALRDPEKAQQSVDLDIEYINTWSLGLDLRIMVRTVLFGLKGRHVF